MTHVVHNTDIQPRFDGRVWRDKYGTVHSTIDLDGARTYLSFGDPADARTLAAECIKAAEAMEQFAADEPASPTKTPAEEEQ